MNSKFLYACCNVLYRDKSICSVSHDAIAVQEHHKERANEIMLETWSEVVSEMCGQKVGTVTKFE